MGRLQAYLEMRCGVEGQISAMQNKFHNKKDTFPLFYV